MFLHRLKPNGMASLERRNKIPTSSSLKDVELSNLSGSALDDDDVTDDETSLSANPGRYTYNYIPFYKFNFFTGLFATLSCPFISTVFHFEETTKTHCNVLNLLPSFSAAIGYGFPETSIWNFCICVLQSQRILDAFAVYLFHSKTAPTGYTALNQRSSTTITSTSSSLPWKVRNYGLLNRIHSITMVIENLFLALLTYVSSTHSNEVHQLGFVGFLLFTIINMSVCLILYSAKSQFEPLPASTRLSYNIKIASFISFFVCAGLAVYFFMRHENYCEPYIYTFFAFFEYSLILSNGLFRYSSAIDMKDITVTIEM